MSEVVRRYAQPSGSDPCLSQPRAIFNGKLARIAEERCSSSHKCCTSDEDGIDKSEARFVYFGMIIKSDMLKGLKRRESRNHCTV